METIKLTFSIGLFVLSLSLSADALTGRSLPNDTNCGVPFYSPNSPSKRIVGGTEVAPNSWPWAALLKHSGNLACGGTLVRQRNGSHVVITAAHCVDGSLADPAPWEVRLGFHSRTSATFEPYYQSFKVKQIILHENFTANTLQNDIAILVLDGDVQETNGVRPACVTRQIYTPGESCVSLGWGPPQSDAPESDRLNEIYKPLLATGDCTAVFGTVFDPVTMMCAGLEAGFAGPCLRDSGGPLLCPRNGKWYLTGIISWSFICGLTTDPPVYTNVFEYAVSGWLTDVAGL